MEWFKLRQNSKAMVARPALIYGSKYWTIYDRAGRDLTVAKMKMYRISLGATKQDGISSLTQRAAYSRYVAHKRSFIDRVKNERNNWFVKVHAKNCGFYRRYSAASRKRILYSLN